MVNIKQSEDDSINSIDRRSIVSEKRNKKKRNNLTERAQKEGNEYLNLVINNLTDRFWIDALNKLTVNHFQRGVYIRDNCIYCTIRGKEFAYNMLNKPVELLCSEIIELFQEKLDMYSSADNEILQNEYIKSVMDNSSINTISADSLWSKIRVKDIKTELIMKYCITMSEMYNLTREEMMCMYRKLILYILDSTHKLIDPDDIIIGENVIDEIKGVNFDTVNRQIVVDIDYANVLELCIKKNEKSNKKPVSNQSCPLPVLFAKRIS